MFIRKLTSKEVSTKYGIKSKWIVTDENSKMYNSWIGSWNKDWKEGDEISIKESQITSRDWEGKTYFTIQAPPEAKKPRGGGSIDLSPVIEALRRIWEQNCLIIGKLNGLSELLNTTNKESKPIDNKDETPF